MTLKQAIQELIKRKPRDPDEAVAVLTHAFSAEAVDHLRRTTLDAALKELTVGDLLDLGEFVDE